MRRPGLAVGASCIFVAAVFAEKPIGDVDDWYQMQYAPQWEEDAWTKGKVFAAFYDEIIVVHSDDGTVTEFKSAPWLEEALAGWEAEGWVGSDVSTYESDKLNPTTTTFKAKWRDWYEDGSEEFSCGWYMADHKDGRWVFTHYADIDCAKHDL